jgi:hypothetical protein
MFGSFDSYSEDLPMSDGSLGNFVFWMVVGVGIMYAIGKWREGK